MKTVRQLLEDKGSEVWSIGPDASVFEALGLMADKGIGALLVLDAGKPVGLLSERDYARKVILKGHSSKELRVGEIMTTEIAWAHPEQSVEECMAIVTERRERHLPVLDDGRIVGLISIGDLVKAIIDHQQFVIEQLEGYISR
ncbi:MAG TPA: CBS domain-containing protein [Gammaproteobacteria bacterium]|nr:CBS domain-containing protein [Gammaproteobacteria bacterium]